MSLIKKKQSNSSGESDEDPANFQATKLKEPIDLAKLSNEGGTFEIDVNSEDEADKEEEHVVFPGYDPQIFTAVTTGRYCVGSDVSESDEEAEPFSILGSKMEDISGDGGVLKTIVQPGIGLNIPEGATVKYKYSAYLEHSEDPFDSTLFRKVPQKTHISRCDAIPGLLVALQSMRKKENAHFLVRSDYAFGKIGCPPRIPAEATIFYDITLLDAVDYSASESFGKLSEEDTYKAPFEQKVKVTEDYVQKGNYYFSQKQFQKAKSSYRSGTCIIESARIADETESKQQLSLLFQLHLNNAQANLSLGDAKGACKRCQDALRYCRSQPKDKMAKLFYRYSEAKRYLHDYAKALEYGRRARGFSDSKDVRLLLQRIAEDKADAEKEHKIVYQRMFPSYTAPKNASVGLLLDEDFKEDVERHIDHVLEHPNEDLNIAHNFSEKQVAYIKSQLAQAGLQYSVLTLNKKRFFKLYK